MNNKIIGKINDYKITEKELGIVSNINLNLDSQTNWAFLLTLTGYKEKDEIEVDGDNFYKIDKLNDFGSFILNDTRVAPRSFSLQTTFNGKEKKPIKKTKNFFDSIVSFSGGIDSTAGLLMEIDQNKKTIPLWVGFGQKNEKDELKVIDHLSDKLGINTKKIHLDFKKYVDSGWSRWKLGIIPARNYLFASLAANYSSSFVNQKNKIWICAHKEEITPANTDKSERFFETSTKIFSSFYDKQIEVDTPFRNFTKPEIVSIWHRQWEKKYGIKPQDTVSCYYGNNCGVCKACLNRAVSFICAGISLENFLINPFLDSQGLIKNSYISRFEYLENERKLDFIYAMKDNYKFLPKDLKKIVDEKYDQYKKPIEDRLKLINSSELK